MADKFLTKAVSGTNAQDASAPEQRQPILQTSLDLIGTQLQSVPVPVKFKQSVQGIMSDARLLLTESAHSCTAGGGLCSHTLETAQRETAGLSAISKNSTQPFYLTDAMVNLTQLEHAAAGLQWFDARRSSALITNTYFLETCFFPPVYWCLCPSDPAKDS